MTAHERARDRTFRGRARLQLADSVAGKSLCPAFAEGDDDLVSVELASLLLGVRSVLQPYEYRRGCHHHPCKRSTIDPANNLTCRAVDSLTGDDAEDDASWRRIGIGVRVVDTSPQFCCIVVHDCARRTGGAR